MKKLSILILALILVSGCSKASVQNFKDFQKEITSAIEKNSESGSFAFNFSGDFNMIAEVDGESENVDVMFDVAGRTVDKDVQVSLSAKGVADQTDGEFDVSGELRMVEKTLYAKLDSVKTGDESVQLPMGDSWISMPVPEDVYNDAIAGPVLGGFEAESEDPEVKAEIQALMDRTDFFRKLTKKSQNVDGESMTVYEGVLHNENFKEFLFEVSRIQGEEVTAEERQEAEDFFDDLEAKAMFAVDKDGYMRMMSADLTTEFDRDGSQASVELEFEVTYSGFGDETPIEAPQGASSLDALFGGMLGGILGGASVENEVVIPQGMPALPQGLDPEVMKQLEQYGY